VIICDTATDIVTLIAADLKAGPSNALAPSQSIIRTIKSPPNLHDLFVAVI